MRHFIKTLIVLILFSLILSCNSDIIYDDIQKISSDGWTTEKILSFRAPVNDTASSYNIYFHVRNTSKYEYRNLWLFINTIAPNGESLRDTTEFFLADQSGQWLGKGLGSVNTMLLPYKINVRFPHRGIYTFEIQHGMRKEILENILDVGIRIQQYQN